MKKNLIIHSICLLFMAAGWVGCEESITMDLAKLPDETSMDHTAGVLRSTSTLTNKIPVNLTEGDQSATEEIFYWLSQPAETAITVTAMADEKLVEEYNLKNNTKLASLPADNVQFEGGGGLSIASGKQESSKIKMTISTKDLEPGTPYLLSVTLAQAPTGTATQTEKQILYYGINIREKQTSVIPYPGYPEMDIPSLNANPFTVFYVNTSTYQPLIIGVFYFIRTDWTTWENTEFIIGNIVNLKTVTVGYAPASKRALLNLDKDMRYVLEHADKYIRPLQDHGRKVCLCIQSGGQGLGFCNMDDAQIADFAQQVKEVIALYQLDGVNLWDEGSGYGEEGMPAANTTSYPKLIKALREALPGKLLTLVDKGNPTASFHDATLSGGIEVGKFIDYAWHGYVSNQEMVQIVEPWESDHPYSEYTRKPIAGLNPERYGSVNIPFYLDKSTALITQMSEPIIKWRQAGRKKNNIIVYGNDAVGHEIGAYEQGMDVGISSSMLCVPDDGLIWGQNPYPPYDWGAQMGPASYGLQFLNQYYNFTYRVYAKDW